MCNNIIIYYNVLNIYTENLHNIHYTCIVNDVNVIKHFDGSLVLYVYRYLPILTIKNK